jgi:hypothetical protein
MRINTASIIAIITLAVGLNFGKSLLWLPASILVAAVIDLFAQPYYSSPKLGHWQNTTAFLKFLLSLIGFYATVGQLICMGLLLWWFVA